MKKLLSLTTALMLGLALSVGAQGYQNQPQPTDDQQQAPQKGKNQQDTEKPAGPSSGHSSREEMKDTSKPAKMKSGGTATTKATTKGEAVQSTTVFRNGKQTSERLSLHQGTRDRTDVHFSVGTHPRDWWLHTYSIVLISGCHYFLADDGCWYPAFGFDPSCNFPEGVVYCD
jgi:hypothetical protein